MALTKNTQMANRYGLNNKLYDYATYKGDGTDKPIMIIDFANVSHISIEGDAVWATGGQTRGNKVGFNNPLTGSFTLSTQIITPEVLALLAGKSPKDAGKTVVFENTADGTISPYFVITSETVWQDENGTKYSEDLIFHKAKVKRALDIEYDGGADPISVDIEFELATDREGRLLTRGISDIESTAAAPMDYTSQTLGKNISDLISEDTIILQDGTVQGTLHYVEDYADFSSVVEEQSGNYFPFHLNVTGTKMTLKKNGVGRADKTNMDFDADIIFRIPDADTIFSVEVDGKEVIKLNFKSAVLETKN